MVTNFGEPVYPPYNDDSYWRAFLIHITTGQIGPQIRLDATTFSIALNGIDTLSTTVRKSDMPEGLDYTKWLAPWWSGILLMWEDIPIFAGPLTSVPTEDFHSLQITCSGIRAIFADRILDVELTDWSKLAGSTIAYAGYSLGTIAKYVVQQVQEKPGGYLPISYPVADEIKAADDYHTRHYYGYNVQNNSCDQILTLLSNVTNGPDIMFRPRLINASYLVWDLWTGTEADPRIEQDELHVWDTTATSGSVTDLSIVATGAYMTNRVYSIGSGSDRGTLITMSEDLTNIPKGYPLLETSIAVSQSSNKAVVQAYGDANLAANKSALLEITMTVRVDGQMTLRQFKVGDMIEINVKGWFTLSDGVHKCRLLAMTGDLSTASDVKLSLQLDE